MQLWLLRSIYMGAERSASSKSASAAEIPADSDRYSRQKLFRPIGVDGQARIQKATVAVVGCGALGSFQAEALARAGVGKLKLIDRDYVDWSNLQRQWLYDEADASAETPKAIAAKRRLHQLNRDVRVEAFVSDCTPSTADDLISGCDLILDGTDNFETRYLLNDFSVRAGVPWVYGAAIGSYGVAMPIVPGRGPCFACVYPEPPTGLQATCDADGVIAPVTASVAALQVALGLRLLVGWPGFQAFLQSWDIWEGTVRRVAAGAQDPECPVCGRREFRWLEGQKRIPVSLCGRNAVQLHEHERPLNLGQLAEKLRSSRGNAEIRCDLLPGRARHHKRNDRSRHSARTIRAFSRRLTNCNARIRRHPWGRLAQPVRAPALQAGGRRFDPCTAHHINRLFSPASVSTNSTPIR
jgi:molybdopterin-synthase adenylyltransferase